MVQSQVELNVLKWATGTERGELEGDKVSWKLLHTPPFHPSFVVLMTVVIVVAVIGQCYLFLACRRMRAGSVVLM